MKNISEKGQATIEFCIGLIGIMVVIIAIIYFGGIGITSIKTLLNARTYAEVSAAENTEGDEDPEAIASWSYTLGEYSSSESYNIPFLARDTPITDSGFDNDYMTNASDSSGVDDSGRSYNFFTLDAVDDVSYSERLNSGNPAAIAGLVFSDGALPSEVTSGYDDFYTMHKTSNAKEMKENIRDFGLFDFTTIDISDWRSNRVAFPAFSPE